MVGHSSGAGMNELEKLLSTRPDARVAVIGSAQAVSKFIGETEKNLSGAATILFLDENDSLVGNRDEINRHDGPVVLGVRSIRSIPPELRASLVVVKAPRGWRQRLFGKQLGGDRAT